MLDKIDFLIRFWELRARHESVGSPLGPSEQRELLSLFQLVNDDLKLPEARALHASGEAICPAQAMAEVSGVLAIDVRAVTACALLVIAASRLSLHERVIVRAADAVGGVEYSIPCHVAWVHGGTMGTSVTMALVVDGVPTRAVFESDDAAHGALARRARPVFGWKRPVRASDPH